MGKQSKTIKPANYIIIWHLSNKIGLFPLFCAVVCTEKQLFADKV
jgi:hypothetical protein